MGDAAGQLVDVAIHAVEARDLVGDPLVRQLAALGEMPVELAEQADMRIRHQLAEVGDLADFPEQLDALAPDRELRQLGILATSSSSA